MKTKISDMSEAEFKAYHAKGSAALAAYSDKLDAYAANVQRIRAKIAAIDVFMAGM